MKEIKFRARRAENNEWVYGLPASICFTSGISKIRYIIPHNCSANVNEKNYNCLVTAVPIIPETLEQYDNTNKTYEEVDYVAYWGE